jgi:hypothetical protein
MPRTAHSDIPTETPETFSFVVIGYELQNLKQICYDCRRSHIMQSPGGDFANRLFTWR